MKQHASGAERRTNGNERGAILLLTLFVITLLTILILEFSYTTRVEHHIASRFRDEIIALNIAKAGVYETIALLRKDRLREIEEKEMESEKDSGSGEKDEEKGEESARNKGKEETGAEKVVEYPDHYGEEWAQERSMEPFGNGHMSLKVIDETGKININTLVKMQEGAAAAQEAKATQEKKQEEGAKEEDKGEKEEETEKIKIPRRWGQKDKDRTGEETEEAEEEEEGIEEPVRYVVDKKVEKDIIRLIETLDIRGVEPEEVTAAMVDWMDSNDDGDWEDEGYKDSEGVEMPKNAPLEVLSELLMVNGVTADLYFGPKQLEIVEINKTGGKGGRKRAGPGLRDCFTVFSKAKVNVNTAPVEVLTALLEEENASLVKEIVGYTKKRYFEDLKQFEEEIGEHIPASFMAKIGVGSDSFQIISEGHVNDVTKRIRAYVSRDEDANVRILFWRVEE